LVSEEVEADYAVAVDVRVQGDGAEGLGEGEEGYFGCFCWVCLSSGGKRGQEAGWVVGGLERGGRGVTDGVVGAEAETEAVGGI